MSITFSVGYITGSGYLRPPTWTTWLSSKPFCKECKLLWVTFWTPLNGARRGGGLKGLFWLRILLFWFLFVWLLWFLVDTSLISICCWQFAWNARIGHTKDGDNKEHWSHNLGLIFTPITFGLLQWMGQTHILCSKSTVQNICGCHQSKGDN